MDVYGQLILNETRLAGDGTQMTIWMHVHVDISFQTPYKPMSQATMELGGYAGGNLVDSFQLILVETRCACRGSLSWFGLWLDVWKFWEIVWGVSFIEPTTVKKIWFQLILVGSGCAGRCSNDI